MPLGYSRRRWVVPNVEGGGEAGVKIVMGEPLVCVWRTV